jgi:hypothetical protein
MSVSSTPDGQWVLSGSADGCAVFWDPQDGKAYLKLQSHKELISSVALSPVHSLSGGIFATSSVDMTARIWRYHQTAQPPQSGTAGNGSVAPSPEPSSQRPQHQQQQQHQPVPAPQSAQQRQPQQPPEKAALVANQPVDLQQAIPRIAQHLPSPVSPNQDPAPSEHPFVVTTATHLGGSGQQQVPLTELLQFIAKMSTDSPTKLRKTIQGYGATKATISDDKTLLRAVEDQGATAADELRALGAKYDELVLLTPLEQRVGLGALKESSLATKSKELNALNARRQRCFYALEKKTAELRDFEEWAKTFRAALPGTIQALEECLRALSDVEEG